MKMMNIALPRKKSRRGSRPLLTIDARPVVIASTFLQSGRNWQEREITLGERGSMPAADRENRQARQPHRAGFLEEDAAIAVRIDAEGGEEVEEDGTRHDAE